MKKPKPLTIKEYKEFKELSKKLFGEAKFVIFSDEEMNTPEHKKYGAYVHRIQACKAAGVPYIEGQSILFLP